MTRSPEDVVTAYIQAYNDFDFETLESLIHPDIALQHHNRGFQTSGRPDTIALYKGTPEVIPDRALSNRVRIFSSGDRVVVQHALTGTPKVDLPFGPAGIPLNVELVTVFLVKDEMVVEYEDYG